MKICEIVERQLVPPTALKQRARIRGIVKQIAVSQVNKPVTNLEKVLAMQAYAKEKRLVDRHYAAAVQSRQQVQNASLQQAAEYADGSGASSPR